MEQQHNISVVNGTEFKILVRKILSLAFPHSTNDNTREIWSDSRHVCWKSNICRLMFAM